MWPKSKSACLTGWTEANTPWNLILRFGSLALGKMDQNGQLLHCLGVSPAYSPGIPIAVRYACPQHVQSTTVENWRGNVSQILLDTEDEPVVSVKHFGFRMLRTFNKARNHKETSRSSQDPPLHFIFTSFCKPVLHVLK